MTRALEGRRPRNEIGKRRKNLLANYLVITDTQQTETNYIRGLKESLPEQIRDRIQIRIIDNVKTKELIEKADSERAKNPQYSETWLLFDRDKVPNFDGIIEEANSKGIRVGWSNPCIEIWFLAYWGCMNAYANSGQCVSAFKRKFKQRTGIEYTKALKDIYQKLATCGNEQTAIKTACDRFKSNEAKKPSQMDSTTTMYLLVDAIKVTVT